MAERMHYTRMLVCWLVGVLTTSSVVAQHVDSSDSVYTLKGVTVSAHAVEEQEYVQNVVSVGADYLEVHYAGSLMQSLEGIQGVKAVAIGAGLSRPTIRGLGYNRVVVSEDGIKHEGQQWGDDHGLEIDQNVVDKVEVVKGPATLKYGSDAIGGVLNLTSGSLPVYPLVSSATLFGRSVNGQLGGAAYVGGRHKGFFYKCNVTWSDYGDYRVPTDSIQYYSYRIPLKEGWMRNTAGNEWDGRLLIGWTNDRNFRTDLSVMDVQTRSGFFADAYGMEVRLSQIDYDRSRRDVDLPYQEVNHLKVQSHTLWQWEQVVVEANLAWQHNVREEFSEPISHGYMPTPPDSLERAFDKHTLSGALDIHLPLGDVHELNVGSAAERQQNRREGWGFIIPDFETTTWGLYAIDHWQATDYLTIIGGMRYDWGKTTTQAYHDWYATPMEEGGTVYRQRSAELERAMGSLTWSLGGNWHKRNWIMRANAGKAFRMPIAKELGTDGVNYHLMRYEQGNAQLRPEESYQLDAGVEYYWGSLSVKMDPFYNYFPNYIYLNPTPRYVEGLQLYHYTQTQARRWGLEVEVKYRFAQHLDVGLGGQYCRSTQLAGDKQGYTLPFAVPPSSDLDVEWSYRWHGRGKIGLNVHGVATQNDIVPPEKPTPGYVTLNLSASHRMVLQGSGILSVAIMVNNLLDTYYYDHTSYYRLIDVPEPGRNVSVRIKYELNKKEKENETIESNP